MLAFTVSACGGSEEQAVVEQIVVREPGDPAPIPSVPADAPDLVAAGKSAFAMCSACHVAEAGEPSLAGPNLHGVVGRQAGVLGDFAYSEALATSQITWDEAQLDRFLADPAGTLPGTIMVAGAVGDAERRAAIIAYLTSLDE
ncbi:c-type cytochrome [Erythrobacter rubeus]|uniref:C-type cytochrome n=1 Tax=Erythrobacter rubeus TaxID=2760803 RepID=A0ABR8KPH3_9SPHN|nr:c-type cytochrome [Erythrobacter rubeus]MBD2841078.1 c-type cytochrome [Erythrobacter rubeus]